MKNLSDITRAKLTKRLSKLPPRSGHARVLRAKLGISPVVDAPLAAPSAPEPVAPAKKTRTKSRTKKGQ
jgi:hypothetical protein